MHLMRFYEIFSEIKYAIIIATAPKSLLFFQISVEFFLTAVILIIFKFLS